MGAAGDSHDQLRGRFREELGELEALALSGLDQACAQLRRVLEAVEHQDVSLASDVVAGEDAIDEL